jgi:hypothetical protein
MAQNDIAATTDSRFRHSLAKTILVSSVVGLFSVSITVVLASLSSENKAILDSAKFVFGSILPLLGAWVGTLLAFYFSKENFEAATKSVTALAQQIAGGDEKLKQIAVKDKMRPAKDVISWPVKEGEEEKSKLSDILQKFASLERIPMLNEKGCMVYLVYKNILNQYLCQMALDPAKLGTRVLANLTLKDVLDSDAKFKNLFKQSFGFVAETGTLADAKSKMEQIGKTFPCNDVFVTASGAPAEPIVGWVTDNTISENLKV